MESLAEKVKDFKKKLHDRVNQFEADFAEANKELKGINLDKTLADPFTVSTAPERVKKLSKELTEAWVNTFNTVFLKEKDEEKAFRVANAKVKELQESKKPVEKDELKEAGIVKTKDATDMDLDVNDYLSLKEANYDPDTGELKNVIFIEAGTNPVKRRHYPSSVVESAAGDFAGLKMYINHPTKKEEKERPERDVRDWASTITESRGENGKAVGTVAVHDPWLRERLTDPTFKENIGLSINMGGRISYGKVNGQEMQIVEKIIPQRKNGPASVDWVTEAGARGRIPRLLESRREEIEMYENFKVADLKKENPEAYNGLIESIKKDLNTKSTEDQLKESQAKVKSLQEAGKTEKQSIKIDELLEKSSLPEVGKKRVKKDLCEKTFESEEKLVEAVNASMKEELGYINSFSTKGKIKTNTGAGAGDGKGDKDLRENLVDELSGRLGLDEKKKDKDED